MDAVIAVTPTVRKYLPNLFTCLVIFSSWIPVKCEVSDFTSVPTTVKARENNTVLLPCYLNTLSNDGAVALSVRWYKDEVLIGDSANASIELPDRISMWRNGSLEVSDVQPYDTGVYICEIVRSPPWAPVRQKHAIEVLHPPSVKPFPETGFLQVKLGEEVRMSCSASGVPYPIITWTRHRKEIELLDHREVLRFIASDRRLAGTYECTAANGVGEPATARIDLHIIYPPEVSVTRSWIHTAPGLRAQLDCNVAADPQASVTWVKGDKPVKMASRVVYLVSENKHSLLIRKVQRSDFGIYTCKAVNDLGQKEVTIQLSGVPNPGVFKSTDYKNVNARNSYTLIWEVDSYTPVIEFNLWFRRYQPTVNLRKQEWTKLTIPTDHSLGPIYSKQYTLTGLSEKTIYEALVLSRNRYGWSKPSSILRFATSGAEMTEEVATTVQIHHDANMIPEYFIISKATHLFHIGNYFIVILLLCKLIL